MQSKLDQLSVVDQIRSYFVTLLVDYMMEKPAERQDETQMLAQTFSGMRQIVHLAQTGMVSPEHAQVVGGRLFERLKEEPEVIQSWLRLERARRATGARLER